jgi:hypothetical protein
MNRQVGWLFALAFASGSLACESSRSSEVSNRVLGAYAPGLRLGMTLDQLNRGGNTRLGAPYASRAFGTIEDITLRGGVVAVGFEVRSPGDSISGDAVVELYVLSWPPTAMLDRDGAFLARLVPGPLREGCIGPPEAWRERAYYWEEDGRGGVLLAVPRDTHLGQRFPPRTRLYIYSGHYAAHRFAKPSMLNDFRPGPCTNAVPEG